MTQPEKNEPEPDETPAPEAEPTIEPAQTRRPPAELPADIRPTQRTLHNLSQRRIV